ncbi:MAG TPA: ABC transporter ATP-binding protein, partial [Gammaproteobacteria bacterium]|nr:ABC transporter ATP-binding protein [Gammaproteobacteria bacterium]
MSEALPAPMIRLHGLEKSYPYKGGQTWVLRQIGLEINDGDFVTIMGPSGAGKSTLLAILGFLDAEFTGEFWFDGQPVHEMSQKARGKVGKENVGFVFQQFHLLDDLTVSENLDIPLSYRNVARKERDARVAETLDRFQMVGKKDL